jgi:hypothetical protein
MAGLTACGDGVDEVPPTPSAVLRVIQAAAAGGAVRVTWGGHQIAFALDQGESSGGISVDPGTGNLVMQPLAGGLATGSRSLTLVGGRSYVVAGIDSAGVLQPQLLGDTNAVGVPGKSRLRVIHAAAHAPAIDIWRTQPDFPDQVRFMFPFNYRDVSPYFESDPGNWTILVTPAGGTDTLFLSAPFTVGSGKLATAMVMDSSAGGGIWVSVAVDN